MNHWNITGISALSDNYIWVLHNWRHAIVFDPGESPPVIDFLEKKKLHLLSILLTHHHIDHVGGVVDLVERYNSKVYCPNDIRFSSHYSIVGDSLKIIADDSLFVFFQILTLPGHTSSHIAYYSAPFLFCGDVLFAGGCGRVFEGSYEQMFNSLNFLANLPEETKVFCAHEYTRSNLLFAQLVEPCNENLLRRIKEVDILCKKGKPTVPSTVRDERLTNPFLRCHLKEVRVFSEKISGNSCATSCEVFSVLRSYKDKF